jgi:protein required for attachment to host cells
MKAKGISIRQHDWVLVCDGRKALLLENKGDDVFPQLVLREVFEQRLLAARAYGPDAPSRVHQSVGARRSSIELADKHEQAEHAFLQHLAKHLDTALHAAKVKGLIVVAPPRSLGVLRAAYTKVIRQAVKLEVEKDLVSLPIYSIEQTLFAGR